MFMIRGTTAQFKFKSPYPKSELEWATVKFWQPNNPSTLLPITKTLNDCALSNDSYELCFSLTAEETSRFLDKYKAKVQLRALHRVTGAVFGCKPQLVAVYPMSDDIIEENPMFPEESEDGFTILDGENISS
jgi:hypothetical protein